MYREKLNFILLFLVFEILLKHNWYLNIQLNWNINFPPITHFRFSIVAHRNQKSRKENGNVVRTYVWIRPMSYDTLSFRIKQRCLLKIQMFESADNLSETGKIMLWLKKFYFGNFIRNGPPGTSTRCQCCILWPKGAQINHALSVSGVVLKQESQCEICSTNRCVTIVHRHNKNIIWN